MKSTKGTIFASPAPLEMLVLDYWMGVGWDLKGAVKISGHYLHSD